MNGNNDSSKAITLLLNEWKGGNQEAFDELFSYVYAELRRRAASYLKSERKDHTLQTTGLVHEAYLKLCNKQDVDWEDRNHFFAVAALAMRHILVDYARKKNRKKRGSRRFDLPLDEVRGVASKQKSVDLVALDEALNRLAEFDERQAKMVELKYFGGMTLEEVADFQGVSRATVKRDWNIARAWLRRQLEH